MQTLIHSCIYNFRKRQFTRRDFYRWIYRLLN